MKWPTRGWDKQLCSRAQVMSDGCLLVSIIISASLTSLPPGQLHQLQGMMIINKFQSSIISSGVYIAYKAWPTSERVWEDVSTCCWLGPSSLMTISALIGNYLQIRLALTDQAWPIISHLSVSRFLHILPSQCQKSNFSINLQNMFRPKIFRKIFKLGSCLSTIFTLVTVSYIYSDPAQESEGVYPSLEESWVRYYVNIVSGAGQVRWGEVKRSRVRTNTSGTTW